MFIILGIMFCGVALGLLAGRRRKLASVVSKAVMPVICVLLFCMGVSVGGNAQVMENLSTLGKEALLLTAGCIAGSLAAAWALWTFVIKKRTDGDA